MLTDKKHLFNLPENITYLNGAYMSPQLKKTTEIGIKALQQKEMPHTYTGDDFFDVPKNLKQQFAELIDVQDYRQIAVIPSASYGIANVANNVCLKQGDEIILLEAQFPSNVYPWQQVAKRFGAEIKIVKAPVEFEGRGKRWNDYLLAAITDKTAAVAMPPCHWADGTLYNLKAIREKTEKHDALLIIDGSQYIGAAPFSVKELRPDAVITVGYKWLLGPYSLGVAYYSDRFNEGRPIEDNWINRDQSEDFTQLVNYNPSYQPKAGRYNMGECSNFIGAPMLGHSIGEIMAWQPKRIEQYAHKITKNAIDKLREKGCFIERSDYRGKHLFGVYLPEHISLEKLKEKLLAENISVSYRGSAIRISAHVYNDVGDFERLVGCFEEME